MLKNTFLSHHKKNLKSKKISRILSSADKCKLPFQQQAPTFDINMLSLSRRLTQLLEA